MLLLIIRVDLQGLRGADALGNNVVCAGLEARSLHQSTPTSDVLGHVVPRFSVNHVSSDDMQQYRALGHFLLRSSKLA